MFSVRAKPRPTRIITLLRHWLRTLGVSNAAAKLREGGAHVMRTESLQTVSGERLVRSSCGEHRPRRWLDRLDSRPRVSMDYIKIIIVSNRAYS